MNPTPATMTTAFQFSYSTSKEDVLWVISDLSRCPSRYGRILDWLNAMNLDQLRDLVAHVAAQPIGTYMIADYLKQLCKQSKTK